MSDVSKTFEDLKQEYESGEADWSDGEEGDRSGEDSQDDGRDGRDAGAEGTNGATAESIPARGRTNHAEDSAGRGTEDVAASGAARNASEASEAVEAGEADSAESGGDPDGPNGSRERARKRARGRGDRKEGRKSEEKEGRKSEEKEEEGEGSEPRRLPNGEVIVADFVASFVAGGEGSFDPIKGRVVMSDRRMVLATSESKTVVPLASIFDLAVGQVPPEVEEFFDHTLMIGYIVDGERKRTVVGGGRETINKFSLMVFRATIKGSESRLIHPAKVGGRVRSTTPRTAELDLDPRHVRFHTSEETIEIGLASVVFFEVLERELDDESRPFLSVRHLRDDGQTVTTEASLSSRRKLNILGRYLRLTYAFMKAEAESASVTDAGQEVLTALYSVGEGVDLSAVVSFDEDELRAELDRLSEEGLVDGGEDPSLTPQGRLLVIREIEDVNV